MKIAIRILAFAIASNALLAQADDELEVTRQLKAISPYGGFYNVYAVSCHDSLSKTLVSFNQGRLWCARVAKQVSCGRRQKPVALMACGQAPTAGVKKGMAIWLPVLGQSK